MNQNFRKQSIGSILSLSVFIFSIFSTQQAFAMNGESSTGSKPLSSTTPKKGQSLVNVEICNDVQGGIEIKRKGTGLYTLLNGTKDAGHGLRTYEYKCISGTKYKVSWVEAGNPMSKPLSKPLSSPLSKPLSSPLSKPLSSPISKPLSTPISSPGEAGKEKPKASKKGVSKIKVAECSEITGGIKIKKKGSRFYSVLKNGIKDTGHGLRDYTYTCVSDVKYQIKWVQI